MQAIIDGIGFYIGELLGRVLVFIILLAIFLVPAYLWGAWRKRMKRGPRDKEDA